MQHPESTPNPTNEALAEHMHLVRRIVAHFMRRLPRSVQRDDLLAAGTMGLFYALRSSTHTCPEMFTSYACIRIRGAILDELRRHDWAPRRRKPKQLTETPVVRDAGKDRTNVVDLAAVRAAREAAVDAAVEPVAIRVIGFDDLPETTMIAEDTRSALDRVQEKREHECLRDAVAALAPRERDIIRMRYFEEMPSKAIASALGLSEARISQLHARATAWLRERLTVEGGELQELAA